MFISVLVKWISSCKDTGSLRMYVDLHFDEYKGKYIQWYSLTTWWGKKNVAKRHLNQYVLYVRTWKSVISKAASPLQMRNKTQV